MYTLVLFSEKFFYLLILRAFTLAHTEMEAKYESNIFRISALVSVNKKAERIKNIRVPL